MKLRFGWKLSSYSSFDITRTRPKKRELLQSTFDLIAEKNSFDVALYDCAANLFQAAVTKNAGEVSRIVRELEAARTQDRLSSARFLICSAGRKAINRAYSAL